VLSLGSLEGLGSGKEKYKSLGISGVGFKVWDSSFEDAGKARLHVGEEVQGKEKPN
jgi:hypothetical protein